MADLLLGLDIGTSGVKVGVLDPEGRLLGLGRAGHANDAPEPGWVECDPERWWQGVLSGIRQACDVAGVEAHDIAAVGVSVLFPCVAPLDGQGKALHPALLYCDRRSQRQADAIAARIPRDRFEAIVGNVLTPGNCAVTSMAWLRDERPHAFAGAACLAFANTAITARLTGEFCTDPSMVALSGLADIREPRAWSAELCDALEIDRARLPAIVDAGDVVGAVTAAAAAETGLRAGVPVVCGCGDVPASALGVGAVDSSTVIYVAGSTDCIAVPTTAPTPDLRWVNAAYVPRGRWLPIGTATSSGVSVEWFTREFLDGGVQEMMALAEQADLGSGRVLYVPYLQGERTPIWDPQARGIFFGLSSTTTRADLARAVLEGTAFGLRQIMECLEGVVDEPVSEIRAVGGGTRNPLWNQMKADVLRTRLAVLEFQETSALGAALLAGLGLGLYDSFETAASVARAANRTHIIEPDERRASRYDELYELFGELYPATRELAHRLGGVL